MAALAAEVLVVAEASEAEAALVVASAVEASVAVVPAGDGNSGCKALES